MTQPVNLVRCRRMRHDAHAMERRWLLPLSIGGGAVLLVAIFVLLGRGSKTPEALEAGPEVDASTSVDATAPAWLNATSAPTNASAMPTLTATQAPTPTPANPLIGDAVVVPSPPLDVEAGTPPANVPPTGTPLIGGTPEQIAAVLKDHIAGLEADIAKKEAAGQHEQAEREKKSLERLKGQLDMVLDGGPP